MMYTWQEIEQDWLVGSSDLAASHDEVVATFNTVGKYFGREWVESSRVRGRSVGQGTSPTLAIVALGRLLQALGDIPNTTPLLSKVRNMRADARAELIAIYLLRLYSPNVSVDIEPEVKVGDRNRKPDFRVRRGKEPWTYVEVTNPHESELQRGVLGGLERLTSL